MKNKKRTSLYLLLILVGSFLILRTSIGTILTSQPWWTYLVIIGIILSGYLSLKYSREDKHIEKEWIEKEGNVYLERIEQEKERRHI